MTQNGIPLYRLHGIRACRGTLVFLVSNLMSNLKVTVPPEPGKSLETHLDKTNTFAWRHYVDLARMRSWPMGSDLVWYPSSKSEIPCNPNVELNIDLLQCGDY